MSEKKEIEFIIFKIWMYSLLSMLSAIMLIDSIKMVNSLPEDLLTYRINVFYIISVLCFSVLLLYINLTHYKALKIKERTKEGEK